MVLITYYLCKIKKDIIEKLGLIVILIFFAFFIDSILFFLFGFNFPIDKMGNDRFSSFFGDEKVLGGYVARLAPLGLIFISAIRQEKNKKIFFSIYLLLASYLIFLSGERTALIIFFIQLIIIILFFPKLRKILFTFFFILSIFTTLLIYFPQTKNFQNLLREYFCIL